MIDILVSQLKVKLRKIGGGEKFVTNIKLGVKLGGLIKGLSLKFSGI
ncbi:MAG: hypothetical protein KDI92_06500 [Xanthomonadales bacterium]|nr:hypothetical protein [Xanthomonadales bacterium]